MGQKDQEIWIFVDPLLDKVNKGQLVNTRNQHVLQDASSFHEIPIRGDMAHCKECMEIAGEVVKCENFLPNQIVSTELWMALKNGRCESNKVRSVRVILAKRKHPNAIPKPRLISLFPVQLLGIKEQTTKFHVILQIQWNVQPHQPSTTHCLHDQVARHGGNVH